jgi:hypothetical protein
VSFKIKKENYKLRPEKKYFDLNFIKCTPSEGPQTWGPSEGVHEILPTFSQVSNSNPPVGGTNHKFCLPALTGGQAGRQEVPR